MSESRNMTITEALEQATDLFLSGSDTARQDASVLLAHILQQPRSWIIAHPEELLVEEQLENLSQLLMKVSQGVPLPYLLGHWEFYGLDFIVGEGALIPRPETELLVTTAIEWLTAHPERRLAADIGTGSGCIAISLAIQTPGLTVFATDLSACALDIARQNTRRYALENRVNLIRGDLEKALPIHVDLLCANLPYIPSHDLAHLPVSRYEPNLALDGGEDGLRVIRRFLCLSPRWILPGGRIILEIESRQGKQAEALAKMYFPKATIRCLRDLAAKDRLIVIDLTEV
jgi:release factor glutamine methyltransferase